MTTTTLTVKECEDMPDMVLICNQLTAIAIIKQLDVPSRIETV